MKKLKEVMKKENITLNLIFEHKATRYNITRTFDEIYINDEKCETEKEYLNFLNKILDAKEYSFRELFSRFFRTDKDSYIDAVRQIAKEKTYQNNLINAYLLDLDLDYLKKKRELKIKSDRLKVLIKELKEIQKNIDKEKEIEFEAKLKKIRKHLESFEIAEDFNDLKKEADILTDEIQKLRNEIAFLNREIRNKENIINVNRQSSIDVSKIEYMYREAEFFLGKNVLEHISSVQDFHETLFKNRRNKAIKDIDVLTNKINKLEKVEKEKDLRRSQIFKYLENKGALEEYHTLTKEKDNILSYLDEIQRNQKILLSFKKEQADIKIEINKFRRDLIELETILRDRIEFLQNAFREISEEYYDDKPGYLDIEINNNFNTERLYNITPIIKGDSSDGINEMKVFIYDMLIYKLNPTLIGLIGHDNRLFDMVDERQIAKALQYASNNLSQYICSISDTKMNEVKELVDLDWQGSIILNLNEKNKLFGFDFEE
ncbi:DUF2326 domain-containing protein [Pasteurella skyensis]|uniref:DUF2326 domain-containing protein n=1 Tax=Phocoenobacter skyensis TaxID=97481 RepID=A0AAJ6NBX5_9PAST|nr:DUF2326 domain-containing protein [Pasteurella skyensis]MDP8169714.1 DUF2326 domain-containing protein [Pasteurella skyensis]MDP8173960.1 DUF2326 domain-containing protein [Pasteurella skyensis]